MAKFKKKLNPGTKRHGAKVAGDAAKVAGKQPQTASSTPAKNVVDKAEKKKGKVRTAASILYPSQDDNP